MPPAPSCQGCPGATCHLGAQPSPPPDPPQEQRRLRRGPASPLPRGLMSFLTSRLQGAVERFDSEQVIRMRPRLLCPQREAAKRRTGPWRGVYPSGGFALWPPGPARLHRLPRGPGLCPRGTPEGTACWRVVRLDRLARNPLRVGCPAGRTRALAGSGSGPCCVTGSPCLTSLGRRLRRCARAKQDTLALATAPCAALEGRQAVPSPPPPTPSSTARGSRALGAGRRALLRLDVSSALCVLRPIWAPLGERAVLICPNSRAASRPRAPCHRDPRLCLWRTVGSQEANRPT